MYSDAFISGLTTTVPISDHSPVTIFFAPSYNKTFDQKEYGNVVFEEESLQDMSHTLLFLGGPAPYAQVYIVFPRMHSTQPKGSPFLEPDTQEKFINKLLLPAIRQVYQLFYLVPGSYKRCVSDEMHFSSFRCSGRTVNEAVAIMRRETEREEFSEFRDFVFKTASCKFRQGLTNPDCESISKDINWDSIGKEDTFVNFSIAIESNIRDSALFLRNSKKEEFVEMFSQNEKQKTRCMPYASSSLFSGVSAEIYTESRKIPCELTGFSDMKFAFEYRDYYSGKKIYDGRRWMPAMLYQKKNNKTKTLNRYLLDRLSERKHETYTFRVEFLIAASELNEEFVTAIKSKILRCVENDFFVAIDCYQYFTYLESRAEFLIACCNNLKSQRTARSLSGLSVLAYLLSSLILSLGSTMPCVENYIADKRCNTNTLCFIPGAFKLVGNNLLFSNAFEVEILKEYFDEVVNVSAMVGKIKTSTIIK